MEETVKISLKKYEKMKSKADKYDEAKKEIDNLEKVVNKFKLLDNLLIDRDITRGVDFEGKIIEFEIDSDVLRDILDIEKTKFVSRRGEMIKSEFKLVDKNTN